MASRMKIVRNNPNATDWNLENGYEANSKMLDYPFRVYDSRLDAALVLFLDIHEKDFEIICNLDFSQGFRVYLSAPGDELKFFENYFQIELLEESVITLKPKFTTASQTLRKYNPNHRKCFFNSERKLRFYTIYTHNNCLHECLANYTKEICKCVKFTQPR